MTPRKPRRAVPRPVVRPVVRRVVRRVTLRRNVVLPDEALAGRFACTFRAGAFARLAAAFDFEDAAFAAARGFAGRLAGAFPDRVAALLVLNFGSIRSPWRFLAMPAANSIQNATDPPVCREG